MPRLVRGDLYAVVPPETDDMLRAVCAEFHGYRRLGSPGRIAYRMEASDRGMYVNRGRVLMPWATYEVWRSDIWRSGIHSYFMKPEDLRR